MGLSRYDPDRDDERLAKILATDDRIAAADLLGSATTGTMRADSDIDLAILPNAGCRLDPGSLVALAADLMQQTGHTADLGILSSANLVYAREAIVTGRRIFTRDRGFADLAAATILRLYARFQEDRQEVVRAYRSK